MRGILELRSRVFPPVSIESWDSVEKLPRMCMFWVAQQRERARLVPTTVRFVETASLAAPTGTFELTLRGFFLFSGVFLGIQRICAKEEKGCSSPIGTHHKGWFSAGIPTHPHTHAHTLTHWAGGRAGAPHTAPEGAGGGRNGGFLLLGGCAPTSS